MSSRRVESKSPIEGSSRRVKSHSEFYAWTECLWYVERVMIVLCIRVRVSIRACVCWCATSLPHASCVLSISDKGKKVGSCVDSFVACVHVCACVFLLSSRRASVKGTKDAVCGKMKFKAGRDPNQVSDVWRQEQVTALSFACECVIATVSISIQALSPLLTLGLLLWCSRSGQGCL